MTRRVVTGLDAAGKSAILVDGPLLPMGPAGAYAWRSQAVPADNAGRDDIEKVPFDFSQMHGGGSTFMLLEFPPRAAPSWHATDTLDYLVVLEGAVTIEVETGEATLGPGDFIVDRGVIHTWRNDGDVIARCAVVTLPAYPVGAGSTV